MSIAPPPAITPNAPAPYNPEFGDQLDDIFVDVQEIAAEFKKGHKTTEFWFTVGTWAFAVLNGIFDFGLDTESVVAAAGASVTYIGGRTFLKRKRLEAIS